MAGHEPQILLVEDEPDDVRLVEEGLADAVTPFALRRVARLGDALTWLRREPPDAVLLDLTLPDSDGMDTIVVLRTYAPRVPIVVFTKRGSQEGPRALRSGANAYLSKDELHPATLVQALEHAIERQHVTNEVLSE